MAYLVVCNRHEHGVKNPTIPELDALIRDKGVVDVFEGCTLPAGEISKLNCVGDLQCTLKWAILACGPSSRTLIVMNMDKTQEVYVFRKNDDGTYAYSGGLRDPDDHGQAARVKESLKKIPVIRVQEGTAQFCKDVMRGDLDAVKKAMQGQVGRVVWGMLLLFILAVGVVVYFYMQNGQNNQALVLSLQMMADMKKRADESERKIDVVKNEQIETQKMVRDHAASLETARDLFADLKNDAKTLAHNQNKLVETVNAQADAQKELDYKVDKYMRNSEDRFNAMASKLSSIPGLMNGIEGPAPKSATWFDTGIGLYYTMVSLITNGIAFALIVACLIGFVMVFCRLFTAFSLAIKLTCKRMKAASKRY
jgi:hypothetical protein